MTKRREIGPREVLETACALAEELGTTPSQVMIAENLGCSKAHVSYVFMTLESHGAIEWISRYSYTIKDSIWLPPIESPFS